MNFCKNRTALNMRGIPFVSLIVMMEHSGGAASPSTDARWPYTADTRSVRGAVCRGEGAVTSYRRGSPWSVIIGTGGTIVSISATTGTI